MATTNYSLPTLESTALFDLVTDYNALANATDAALASVAGLIPTETITEMQGQISALQTLTGSQVTQITTLQSQMSTANGNISTLQSGLETANGNIGTLQTGLQSANQNISTLNQSLKDMFDFSDIYTVNNTNAVINNSNVSFFSASSQIVVAVNKSKTMFKLLKLPQLAVSTNTRQDKVVITSDALPTFPNVTSETLLTNYGIYSGYNPSSAYVSDSGQFDVRILANGKMQIELPYIAANCQTVESFAMPAIAIVGLYNGSNESVI